MIKDQSVSFSVVKLNKGIIREAVNQLTTVGKKKTTTIPTVLGQTASDLHLKLLFYETCCIQVKCIISLKENSELVNMQVFFPPNARV